LPGRESNAKQVLTRSASQGIIISLIEAMDFFAVEALISDLHPRAECTDCRKVFQSETGGLHCCGEATTVDALRGPPLRIEVNSSAGEQ
jgi:hypothetical protein